MSFIKKSIPPPDVKEGQVILARILEMEYPVKGEYKEQIKWRVQLPKEFEGYEATVWTTYYKEPSDKSILGQLCITMMNLAEQSFDTVDESLSAVKKHGKVYVKCTGFREWNETLYPKFQVVPTKLPGVQKDLEDVEQPQAKEDPAIFKLVSKLKAMPENERDEYIKKLASLK